MSRLVRLVLGSAAMVSAGTFDPLERIEKTLVSGAYDDALRQLREVRCAGDPVCRARVHSLQGTAHLYGGRYVEARSEFAAALEMHRQMGRRRPLIEMLNNLGTVDYFQGDYGSALRYYEQAQAELARAKPEPWWQSSSQMTLANVAALYQRLGLYRQALDIYRELGARPAGLVPSEQAQLLSNLAVLNRRLGDPVKCRLLLQQALRLLRRDTHRDTWLGVTKNLGIVLALDFQELGRAEELFLQVLHLAEAGRASREAMQARLYLAETHFRQARLDAAEALWRTSLGESRALQSAEDEWRSLFGLARSERKRGDHARAGQYLEEAAEVISRLRQGIGVPTLRSEFLADKTDVYDELIVLYAARGDVAGVWRSMELARALLLRESLGAGRLSLAECQARLAPDEAMLLFHVGRNASFRLLVEPRAARVDRLQGLDPGWLLRGYSSRATRLWIVPDAALAAISFETLPLAGRPLIESAEVNYLPAGSLLRRSAPPDRGWNWPWQLELAGYAGPRPSAVSLLAADQGWRELPRSVEEVRSAGVQLPGRTVLQSGAAGGPREFLNVARTAPVLHLATHGAGDPEDGERSRILLGNGYLFAGQLAPGSLPAARLVVLSACETGRGQVRGGEGVASLARAFLASGAAAVVATLWKVDDAAAMALMREFYRELAAGLPAGAALRRAKLKLLRSSGPLSASRHWAAFVLYGAGEHPLPHYVSWTQIALAVAALFALLAFGLSKWRAGGRSPGGRSLLPSRR